MKVEEIEKEFPVNFRQKKGTTIQTYLRRVGIPSLAKAFDILEKLEKVKKPKE